MFILNKHTIFVQLPLDRIQEFVQLPLNWHELVQLLVDWREFVQLLVDWLKFVQLLVDWREFVQLPLDRPFVQLPLDRHWKFVVVRPTNYRRHTERTFLVSSSNSYIV